MQGTKFTLKKHCSMETGLPQGTQEQNDCFCSCHPVLRELLRNESNGAAVSLASGHVVIVGENNSKGQNNHRFVTLSIKSNYIGGHQEIVCPVMHSDLLAH